MLGILFTGQLAKLSLVPYPLIGGIIIPISILTAFISMNSWLAVPIVFGFGAIGIVMKMAGWPRPPFILGFILGPIIEANFQSAYSIYGFVGIATRPLSVVLFLSALVLGYFFYRIGVTSTITTPVTEDSATPDAGPQALGGAGGGTLVATASKPALQIAWRQWDNLVAVAVLVGAGMFLVASIDLPVRSRMVPMWTSIAVLVMVMGQLVKNVLFFREGHVEIMDVGMRSSRLGGAMRAALTVGGLLASFVLLATLIGLNYAGIAYALLGPLALGAGKWRWGGAVLAPVVVWIFIFVIADKFAAVYWPEPRLGQWILDLF
jgi:hypothetical protein